MEKSPDAFRTISEVADELNVPQHVLRFWETRFTQIKPMKRAGGRRYYRPADVDLVRGIRVLLYGEGYTIRGVQKIFKDDGAATIVAIGRGEAKARKPELLAEKAPPPALETLVEDVTQHVRPELREQLAEVRPFFEEGKTAEGTFPL